MKLAGSRIAPKDSRALLVTPLTFRNHTVSGPISPKVNRGFVGRSKLVGRGGESFEEAVRLPCWARVGICHSQRQLFQYGVELRCCGGVHRLRHIIFHAVVALLVPIVKEFFFRGAGKPAEFEGQRCRLSTPIAPSSLTYFCINSIVIDESALILRGLPFDSDIT